MKQVVQPFSGRARTIEVPRPSIGSTEVLVQTVTSLISAGTERAVSQIAQSSLVAKARARPDLVRQVVQRARTQGIWQTARTVRSELDGVVALGYSACGTAAEVGDTVSGVEPGQLVATGGANHATHAEWQAVPGMLCVAVPSNVTPTQAAFATVGSIALHGVRQAEPQPGSKVVVIGLGLVGQLAGRLLQASGCDVAGIDVSPYPVERSTAAGIFALQEAAVDTTEAILHWTKGRGADAVILAAASKGSSAAIARTPALCRDRATVVVIGDMGLDLDRGSFYSKELVLKFARSYGPGRYDRSFEDWAVDYPVGHVPFTERRNMETVLDLLSAGKLVVDDLITHTFPVEQADEAYELINARSEPYLGVEIAYNTAASVEAPIIPTHRSRPSIRRTPRSRPYGIGFIGAGGFANSVLVPSFQAAGLDRFVSVASASGLSARRMGERVGFRRVVSGARAVIEDPDIDVVVVATPHSSHADLVTLALQGGKHVFVEKPLALSEDELATVARASEDSGRVLFVGLNRRWSPTIRDLIGHFGPEGSPLTITYRVNAGRLPVGHWYHDRREGGRFLGEGCHFVDTCAAIVGEQTPIAMWAMSYGDGEVLLRDNVVLGLRYPDGSMATISYLADGHPSLGKERIEVFGRGHAAILDDFASITLDGTTTKLAKADKGHRAEAVAFRDAIESGRQLPDFVASTQVTLALATQLGKMNA